MFKKIKNAFKSSPPQAYKYRLKPLKHENGSGFIVIRASDNQRLDWSSLPRLDGLESIGVAGTNYHKKELQSKTFSPGSILTLSPEPNNPHDSNAIAVCDQEKQNKAGYIPGSQAKRIGKKLAAGEYTKVISMWETRKNGKRDGLRILMLSDDAEIRL